LWLTAKHVVTGCDKAYVQTGNKKVSPNGFGVKAGQTTVYSGSGNNESSKLIAGTTRIKNNE
jgi:hypothetical protein